MATELLKRCLQHNKVCQCLNYFNYWGSRLGFLVTYVISFQFGAVDEFSRQS